MQTLIPGLDEPFARMTEAEASRVLETVWGVPGPRVERLDTERDDSFYVLSDEGDFVLKVAHPADDALLVNLQTSALGHVNEVEPLLPLQRVLQSVGGEIEPVVEVGGASRIARVLTWLPGRLLSDSLPDRVQLGMLGESLGRLTSALSTFDHPAAHRVLLWDVARLPLLRPLLEQYPFAEPVAAFELFDRIVAPRLAGLPHQVIHNDFHQGNVLADPAHPAFVVGVLDFGDVVYSARVIDVAVAVSYLLYPAGRSWLEIEPFLDGFGRHVRLEPLELELLPALVAARLAQRILLGSELARHSSETVDDVAAKITGVRATLRDLLDRIGVSR
jgi:hydroxylysine kinase